MESGRPLSAFPTLKSARKCNNLQGPLFCFSTLFVFLLPPTATMVMVSSKTLIQAHAVLLFVIAGYLIKSPDMIVGSNIVFMFGETLRIVRLPPTHARTKHP